MKTFILRKSFSIFQQIPSHNIVAKPPQPQNKTSLLGAFIDSTTHDIEHRLYICSNQQTYKRSLISCVVESKNVADELRGKAMQVANLWSLIAYCSRIESIVFGLQSFGSKILEVPRCFND